MPGAEGREGFLAIRVSKLGGEREERRCTSSGYRSESEFRGMCSVKAKVSIPFAMAVRMTSSRESAAWPGQNCPEWLCIENAILGIVWLEVKWGG